MKKVLRVVLAACLSAMMLAGCGDNGATPTTAPPDANQTQQADQTDPPEQPTQAAADNYKIYLITMDQMDQYWNSIDKGCQEAVAELGNVTYRWTAPDTKDDAKQIEMINNAVADGANAILLAANGPDAVTSALEAAAAANVKIVYVDSPANFTAVKAFTTDNKAAGTTAGTQMLEALTAKGVTSGKIGVISVNASTNSTVMRDEGFRAAFEGKGFELLQTQYGNGDPAASKQLADDLITQGVVGIFGANEGSAVGAGNAIKEAGNKIIGVGFDTSDSIMGLMNDGSLLCTMAQNPDKMGYEGIKAAVGALKGDVAEDNTVVDTGVSIIKADNPSADTPVAAGDKWKIYLITMDQMDQYWNSIDAGCQDAVKALGNVEYRWTAPDTKDDAKQIEMINNAVADGAQAILLAANGPDAVTSALTEADAAGVKIVYVDSPANFPCVKAFTTDNKAAGTTAGKEMLNALQAKGVTSGKIGVISVNASTNSTVQRDEGFRAAFAGTGFELLETQYGNGEPAASKQLADDLITQGVVGIFGANEGSAVGAGNAIKEDGNKVIGVGFDTSDSIKGLLADGALICTMAQNPKNMGDMGIKAAVGALEGTVTADNALTDTGVLVVKE